MVKAQWNLDAVERLTDEACSSDGFHFLNSCYRFVAVTWPHAVRMDIPDSGFEANLRDSLVMKLPTWAISQPREMGLGLGLTPASGILHEIDVVASHDNLTGMVELKQRQDEVVDKNDVILFFAKLLDYFCANPFLLLKELHPVFMTSLSFDMHGLAASLCLGIHPIAPALRPYPLLARNENLMANELAAGLALADRVNDAYLAFATRVSALGRELESTWIGDRFVHLSERQIAILAAQAPEPEVARELLELNSSCTELLHSFRMAKKAQE